MLNHNDCLKILENYSRFFHRETEWVKIENTVGRVLAEDVIANEANPRFDNSAMDGFAIKLGELKEKLKIVVFPLRLKVSGCIGAGEFDCSKFINFSEQECVEIMTGAPMPKGGFDTVIRVEDVTFENKSYITINSFPQIGDNIRRIGEDFHENQILLSKGDVVNPLHLILLSTAGVFKILVYKKIKVGIISTGQEVINYKSTIVKNGQIRNSTGLYLESYLKSNQYDVLNFNEIGDDVELYKKTVTKCFTQNDCDILISTGAVSMGKYDFVSQTLKELNGEIHFHKAAIRPGKPILFSTLKLKNTLKYIFALPGNPVSTVVGLRFFVMPFIEMLQEKILNDQSSNNVNQSQLKVLKNSIKKPQGLKSFLKAKVSTNKEDFVECLSGQASFMVSPFKNTNAWVVLSENINSLESGTEVEVFKL